MDGEGNIIFMLWTWLTTIVCKGGGGAGGGGGACFPGQGQGPSRLYSLRHVFVVLAHNLTVYNLCAT